MIQELSASFLSGAVAVVFILAAGWPVAVALGARPSLPGAWIAGLVMLYTAGIFCEVFGLAVTLLNLGALSYTGAAIVWVVQTSERRDGKVSPDFLRLQLGAGAWVAVFVLVLIFIMRAFLQPLEGADTSFRWELLARQILNERNLNFYPPTNPGQFRLYFYPDGISPLAALTHWVCYAVRGIPDPAATYGPVVMTFFIIIWLTLRLAMGFGNTNAASGAAYALAGTPLLFWASVQGQETGLTCLGIVGGIYFLVPKAGHGNSDIMAALSLALTVLAREYGAALVVGVALSAFLFRRHVRWVRILVPTFIIGGSWYVRNYLLTGNPFYPLSFGGFFPVNEVHAGILEACKEVRGWQAIGLQGIVKALGHLAQIAFFPVTCAWLVVLIRPRRWLWVLPIFATGLFVWFQSVNYTAGGIQYSYRVLSPLLPLGCVLAGLMFAHLARSKPPLVFFRFVWHFIAIYGLVNSLTMPLMAKSVPMRGWFSSAFFPKERNFSYSESFKGRVLSDDPYLHASVVRGFSNLDVLPIWSPEVAFLFDDKLSAKDKVRKLREAGIAYITSCDPASVWWPFFTKSEFFRQAFATWPKDASGYYCIVPSNEDYDAKYPPGPSAQ